MSELPWCTCIRSRNLTTDGWTCADQATDLWVHAVCGKPSRAIWQRRFGRVDDDRDARKMLGNHPVTPTPEDSITHSDTTKPQVRPDTCAESKQLGLW